MLKVSTFLAETEYGYSAVPLFGPSDGEFEKRASPHLLPPVLKYIENLRPQRNSQYVLVNALAAGEYFGSNINGDHFPEAGLIHCPQGWTGNPTVDMALSKDWAYGFPSFYNANPFAHHRNKDPSRAYGGVELALWNGIMKRVELVVRVDYDKCQKFGGIPVWDKLKSGAFPDVSMGCLPSGSLITMSDGTQKPIELVRETEMVLTHTGAHRRVTDTMRRHHPGSVFRFNVYGFRRELVVTGNHPLWLVDGEQLRCDPQPHTVNKGRKQRHCTPFVKGASKGCSSCSVVPSYEFEWRRADEAQVGDYLAFPVPTLSTSGALQGNRSLARLLGYYLAEGHVSNYNDRPREQVNFSLNYEENELAEEIEKLARSLGVEVLWHHEKPEVGSRTVSIVSKTLASLCSFHCGDGAKTKVLSQEVLHEDPALLLELLGAYLNGDGGTYKGSLYFSTSSEQLAHQLFIALARCGLVASVNKDEHKPSEKSVVRKETTEYQVWVGTDFSWKLERYISKPVRHSIKVRGQRFFYNNGGVTYLMAPILEIDEAPHDADVFNFSVEGDESYVAEGLAVHNSKVPYDTSSITLDWKLYREAQATFDPKKHKHPGMAVLEFHKKLKAKDGKGIPGLSVTRDDYDSWCRTKMNKILPDGRKVFVYNDYPRFFDISFVFIGADRTAKTMVFIFQSSVKVACDLGYVDYSSFVEQPVVGMDKAASVSDDVLAEAFGLKSAELKRAEIDKDVVPSQMAGKAIPVLNRSEPDLPSDLLRALASRPEDEALSTSGALGIILRPREFQKITLIRMGHSPLANGLEDAGVTFPKVDEVDRSTKLGPEKFSPALAKALEPMMGDRSLLGPAIERRIVMISMSPSGKKNPPTSHSSPLLRKIGAAYNGYRAQLMEYVAHTKDCLQKVASTGEDFDKLSSATPEDTFTPLSYCYLRDAFLDELGVPMSGKVVVEP
jgi:intein/homing endonuclease